MMLQVAAAFIGTIGFSVMFNVSRFQLLYCGGVGALGWFVYSISYYFLQDSIYASFIASLAISIASHVLARIRKNPVTVYQIIGIFPLVPGAGMYKTLYYIVNEKYLLSIEYFFQTLQIAGGIAAGMILIASIDKLLYSLKR